MNIFSHPSAIEERVLYGTVEVPDETGFMVTTKHSGDIDVEAIFLSAEPKSSDVFAVKDVLQQQAEAYATQCKLVILESRINLSNTQTCGEEMHGMSRYKMTWRMQAQRPR